MEFEYMKFEKMEKSLRLHLTEEGRELLSEYATRRTEKRSNMFGSLPDVEIIEWCKPHDVILSELFEDVHGNSEIELLPEYDYLSFGALTSAPIIAFGVERNDQGELQDVSEIYWFPDYAVISELDELLKRGFVDFPKASQALATGGGAD